MNQKDRQPLTEREKILLAFKLKKTQKKVK